jgi:hypothetical protein
MRTGLPLLVLALSLPCSAGTETFDLLKIAQLGGKGRIQDAQYQPKDAQVSAILAAGKDAVPLLIDALESARPYEISPNSFWPVMAEGDVALIVLSDLFLDPTWKRSTLPELCWDNILQRTDAETPAWDLLNTFVKAHGRAELAKRWRAAWARHSAAIRWDPAGRYFVVEGQALAACAPNKSLERTREG